MLLFNSGIIHITKLEVHKKKERERSKVQTVSYLLLFGLAVLLVMMMIYDVCIWKCHCRPRDCLKGVHTQCSLHYAKGNISVTRKGKTSHQRISSDLHYIICSDVCLTLYIMSSPWHCWSPVMGSVHFPVFLLQISSLCFWLKHLLQRTKIVYSVLLYCCGPCIHYYLSFHYYCTCWVIT